MNIRPHAAATAALGMLLALSACVPASSEEPMNTEQSNAAASQTGTTQASPREILLNMLRVMDEYSLDLNSRQ